MKEYIYKIQFPNGKVYIGKTINPTNRWYGHRTKSNCGSKTKVHVAMRKFGLDNLKFEVIYETTTDRVFDDERMFIEKFDSVNNGYNTVKGTIPYSPDTPKPENYGEYYKVSHNYAIGRKFKTKQGYEVEIVGKHENYRRVIIEFKEPIVCRVDVDKSSLKRGECINPNHVGYTGKNKYSRHHIGEKFTTNEGYEVEIVDGGIKPNSVIVEFKKPFKFRAEKNYYDTLKGVIINPNSYLGNNKYMREHIGYIYKTKSKKSVVVIDGGTTQNTFIVKDIGGTELYEMHYNNIINENKKGRAKHSNNGKFHQHAIGEIFKDSKSRIIKIIDGGSKRGKVLVDICGKEKEMTYEYLKKNYRV